MVTPPTRYRGLAISAGAPSTELSEPARWPSREGHLPWARCVHLRHEHIRENTPARFSDVCWLSTAKVCQLNS